MHMLSTIIEKKRKKRRITKKNAKKKNVNRMFFSTSLGNGAKSTIIEAFIIYCCLLYTSDAADE